ncbi:hypothetical protein ACR9PC_004255, partial [Vibrio vulnificus]
FFDYGDEMERKTTDALWRYMDFSKFVDLLLFKKMFFPRLDRFQDEFEGSLPKVYSDFINAGTVETLKIVAAATGSTIEEIIDAQPDPRELVYVSCWFMSNHESRGMWDLYTTSADSVAIKSSIPELEQLFAHNPNICGFPVRYVDYEDPNILKDWLGEGFMPGFDTPVQLSSIKRIEFKHENEFRIVRYVHQSMKNTPLMKHQKDNIEFGLNSYLSDLDFIESITFHPESSKWFQETVIELLKKLDFNIQCHQSNLKSSPNFTNLKSLNKSVSG